MAAAVTTHVLLDFFGTLVHYSPSRTEQGYPQSYQLVTGHGAQLSYAGFLSEWAAESARFDARSARDNSEFSMTELATAFLSRQLGSLVRPAFAAEFVSTYVAEWDAGVSYPPGIPALIAELAGSFCLAVVTNTHEPRLVPDHLAAMGIARYIDAVITSVEVGWRKPHPAIYAEALRRLGITAANAVFVGDTYDADYAGPEAAGITAFLIDPAGQHDILASQCLRSLADLPSRLRGWP
jgi:putative hydrolase of the HAD superfamily